MLLLTFTSCEKAKNEKEVKSMIVGTWKAKIKNRGFPFDNTYIILEFTPDSRCQFIQWYGADSKFEAIDTSGLNHDDYTYVSTSDSLYYSIEGFNINFNITSDRTEEIILNASEPFPFRFFIENSITKLTNKKLKLAGYDNAFKRKN